MFRRRRRPEDAENASENAFESDQPDEYDDVSDDPVDDGFDGTFDDGGAPARDPSGVQPARASAGTTGPWDALDEPSDGVPRLDLGGMRVPVPQGIELRVEVDPQTQSVVAAVLMDGPSALQLGAFAAPKSGGIWPEVADEIVAGLRTAGGGGDPVDGTFGRELAARIPMEGPSGQRVVQPARFVGVDGPRWFLRGLFQGPAATDPEQARKLEDVFRGVVVVRGTDAMAPRDPLPLRMPKELVEAGQTDGAAESAADGSVADAADTEGAASDDQYSLDPFERGPEITETR